MRRRGPVFGVTCPLVSCPFQGKDLSSRNDGTQDLADIALIVQQLVGDVVEDLFASLLVPVLGAGCAAGLKHVDLVQADRIQFCPSIEARSIASSILGD